MSRSYLNYHEFINWFRGLVQNEGAEQLEFEGFTLRSGTEGCQIPLLLQSPDLTLTELKVQVDSCKPDLLILMQSGRASLALIAGDEILVEKHIRKYMNRMSQGRSQMSYLNQKGKSRLGSRIRLRQSEQFFVEINQVLASWIKGHEVRFLFLSCSPKLKGIWLDDPDKVFDKKDPRWRRIPLNVHPPDRAELRRILKLMCRAELWEFES